MAKTKFSIWRYIICEICKKNGSNRPFLASRVADTIFPPPIEGHHRQLDNQCKDPMDKTKDCRVGQLTRLFLALGLPSPLSQCSSIRFMFMIFSKGKSMNRQLHRLTNNLQCGNVVAKKMTANTFVMVFWREVCLVPQV